MSKCEYKLGGGGGVGFRNISERRVEGRGVRTNEGGVI